MDLTATFLAAAGAKLPADYIGDGLNLLPILTGAQPEVERTFFWRINRSNRLMSAVRHGRWKYLSDGNTMDLLFDLSADIGERHNLGYQHPEVLRDLKARLKTWEAEMDASAREFVVR
jgi:arylsulfatase A-like enzyme